jgi:Trypsin-co-occurring domain 2
MWSFSDIYGNLAIAFCSLSLILSTAGSGLLRCSAADLCVPGTCFAMTAWGVGVTDEVMTDDAPDGWVNLSVAIAALRRDLAAAWWDGRGQRVRFKVEPVELTVEAGVTKKGTGQAGVKWHILTLGGARSRENKATQKLNLKLTPVFFDEQGRRLPDGDQLVSGPDIFTDEPDEPERS